MKSAPNLFSFKSPVHKSWTNNRFGQKANLNIKYQNFLHQSVVLSKGVELIVSRNSLEFYFKAIVFCRAT